MERKSDKMKVSVLIQVIADGWRAVRMQFLGSRRDHYGYIHPTAEVEMPGMITKKNVYLYEYTHIGRNADIIATKGKFIMKKYSRAASGLSVVCQNHNMFEVGSYPFDKNWNKGEIAKDVIVEDGVWIGTRVTLCPGTHIGRGCIVAAGAVCTGEYPPYTIIGGVPAKVIKYRFNLEEQIEHEKIILPEAERLSYDYLSSCYQNYK